MKEIRELSSQLFDRLTIIKGYLELNVERKRIDYTPLLLREVGVMEKLVRQIVDALKKRLIYGSGGWFSHSPFAFVNRNTFLFSTSI